MSKNEAKLHKALIELVDSKYYINHAFWCEGLLHSWQSCSCGLYELLAKVDKLLGRYE